MKWGSSYDAVACPYSDSGISMDEIVIHTLDWVPELPRGYVRDLRVRWALEEAGLPYRVESTPLRQKTEEHFAHQPFGQVPWLTHSDMTIFESGAILHYLGTRSEALMPADPSQRAQVTQWLFAALNSVEMPVVPWTLFRFANEEPDSQGWRQLNGFLHGRLKHMDTVLAKTEWLVGDFSVADIAMSDVLRLVDRFEELAAYPKCRAYVARATARPAFRKAHADQLAHFAAADG